MLQFLIRRISYGFLVLVGIIIIVFFLFQVLPGDPARLTMGQRADVMSLKAIRAEFGLDEPIPVQFMMYVNDLSPVSVHENTPKNQRKYSYQKLFPVSQEKVLVLKWPYLRRSYQTKEPVTSILARALPNTIILAVSSMFFASIFGVFLGVIASIRKNSIWDHLSVFLSVIGISTPSWFSAMIFAFVFGYLLSNFTTLNMQGSLYTIDPIEGKVLTLKNLILPMITLGIRPLAIIVQLTRSAMLDVLSKDYIRTAKAKGLAFKNVLFRHALRNALNPVVTAISGWFAALLAGTFFVEFVFGWKGMGLELINSLQQNDFPVVMGVVLVTSVFFVALNIVVDIIYGILDPRVTLND